jgi:hypothetical protein
MQTDSRAGRRLFRSPANAPAYITQPIGSIFFGKSYTSPACVRE